MTEITEQQTHLKSLLEQQNQLSNEINILGNQLTKKRELFLKLQGAIEYLQQVGVSLEQPETEEEVVEETSEPEE